MSRFYEVLHAARENDVESGHCGLRGGGSWATSGLFWTTDTLKQPLPAQELLEASQDVLPPEWLVSGTRVAGRKWDGGVRG